MPEILILGSTGLLASSLAQHLKSKGIYFQTISSSQERAFDASEPGSFSTNFAKRVGKNSVVINAIGLTKQRMIPDNRDTRMRAITTNSLFPHEVAKVVEEQGARMIQVATDCVFSGRGGPYSESDSHDAGDIYGMTKSLGEPTGDSVLNIRASFVGKELEGRGYMLYDWVRHHRGRQVDGYTNHLWNGVTTGFLSALLAGLASQTDLIAGSYHLVPKDYVSKDELVALIAANEGKSLEVIPTEAQTAIDRRLSTNFAEVNEFLFDLGGYTEVPRISELISKVA